MPCHRKAQCAACLTTFSSLCDIHNHLSNGIRRIGYLYSVHVLQNDLLLVYPARDACFYKCTDDYEIPMPPEHQASPTEVVVTSTRKLCGKIEHAKTSEQLSANSKTDTAYPSNGPGTEIHKEKYISAKSPECKLAPTKTGIVYQVDTASTKIPTEKQNSAMMEELSLPKKSCAYQVNDKSTKIHVGKIEAVKCPQQPQVLLSKPNNAVPNPGIRKTLPPEVVVYSAGRVSSFVQDYEIGSEISVFSSKQGETEPHKTSNKSSALKQKPVEMVRNDDSTTESRSSEKDPNTGKRRLYISPQSIGKLLSPSSSGTANTTASFMSECVDDAKGKLETCSSENKDLETARNKSTKYNISHILVLDNKLCRKENNHMLKALSVNKQVDRKERSVEKPNENYNQVVSMVSAETEHEDGYQETESNLKRQYSENVECDGVLVRKDENKLSQKFVSSEADLCLIEHSYFKKSRTCDVQNDQDLSEWQVFCNEDYFEESDSPLFSENTNKEFQEVEVEFPDNNIHSETFTRDPVIIAKLGELNAVDNRMKNAEVSSSRGTKAYSMDTYPSKLKEIDVELSQERKHPLCVFKKYGFKLIQRHHLIIECKFCQQKCFRNTIIRHVKGAHREIKCTLQYRMLGRYLKDNWSADAKFVNISIYRGTMYKFCGFSIKPLPELKVMCTACKIYFCRNDFINHVTGCYKRHEISITDEINGQLEMLKRIIPVFKIREKKVKKVTKIKKDVKPVRKKQENQYQSTRALFKEFKAIKPELFKANMPQFLKEFQEFQVQKQANSRMKRQERISCTKCSKRIRASYMATHMEHVHSSQSYVCDVCGGIKSSKHALNNHHRLVHGEKGQFLCSLCGKEFISESRLRYHSYQVHRETRKLYQCPVCEKCFKKQNILTNHMAIHKDIRPFSCNACEASFKREDHLKVHIDKVHDLKVLWVCSVPGCESTYRYKVQLETHIQRHTGKKFCCSYCPRKYSALKLLNVHMKKEHSVKESKSDRTNTKEIEYGFDGSVRLKTLPVPEGELQPGKTSVFKWTDGENKIFWDVMEKYIETGSAVPYSVKNKVKEELNGTRTLQQIKSKLFVARHRKRQREKSLRHNGENEDKEQMQGTASSVLLKEHVKDRKSASSGIEYEINDDLGHRSDEHLNLADEQIDNTEDVVSQNAMVEMEEIKNPNIEVASHSNLNSERVKVCSSINNDLKRQTYETLSTFHSEVAGITDNVVSLGDDETQCNASVSLKCISNQNTVLDVENVGKLQVSTGIEESQVLNDSLIGNTEISVTHPLSSGEFLDECTTKNTTTNCRAVTETARPEKTSSLTENVYDEESNEDCSAKPSDLQTSIDEWMMNSRFDKTKGKTIHICCLCDKEFATKYSLKYHISIHLRGNSGKRRVTTNKHRCVRCEKLCKSRFDLEDHVNYIHLGLKPHRCIPCKYEYGLRYSLYDHVRLTHKENKDKLVKSDIWTFGS